MVKRIGMVAAIKRVGESHKETLKKLIKRIYSVDFRMENNLTETATLTDAFAALGKASYCIRTIDRCHEILTHGTGTTLPVVTEELFQLKVLCLKLIDLFHEMITAIHQQKEKEALCYSVGRSVTR